MNKVGLSLIFLVSMMACQFVTAAEIVNEIRFQGNKKTKERILRQELTIKPGDSIDRRQLERSRQAIMDLGLFKSVEVDVAEKGIVVFTVSEKRYVLVIPRFSRDRDNDKISPGANLTIDNIAGLNQRVELRYRQSDAANGLSGNVKELEINYQHPKIFATQYSLEVQLGLSHKPLQLITSSVPVAEYSQEEADLVFIVSRWLSKIGPSSGWVAGVGPRLRYSRYDYVSGTPGLLTKDRAVSLLGQIFYTNVHDHLHSRSGVNYGYVLEQGIKGLGSDFDYSRHLFFYRHYKHLGKPHTNLNWQLRIGLSDRVSSSLDEDVFDIGGYGDLRAYDSTVSGNAYVLANIEYLRPVFSRNHVRALLFVDVGDAFARNSDITLSDLKWATGVGLRWKVKSFVNLNFSLEFAYNVETGENKAFFRTSGPF